MSRILVVYSSIFGANAGLAETVQEVLTDLGADVRVRGVPQIVLADKQVEAARALEHTGQERVVDDLNAVGAAWGCVIVPASSADPEVNSLDGNAYGVGFALVDGKVPDPAAAQKVLRAHLTRFVHITDLMEPLAAARRESRNRSSDQARRDSVADVFG